MSYKKICYILIFMVVVTVKGYAADITGTWTATFDTQVGQQNYTYTFSVNGTGLTGSMKSANGESGIENGRIEGDTVSFTENLDFQGMALKISYTGKIISNDEISFTRQVGEFATEQLTAQRVK